MDIVDKLRAYKRDRSGYAEYCHRAADEIERLRMALNAAGAGFDSAYNALEKGFHDEAMLHCGHQRAQIAKVLEFRVEANRRRAGTNEKGTGKAHERNSNS